MAALAVPVRKAGAGSTRAAVVPMWIPMLVHRLQRLEDPSVSRAGIEHGPQLGRELLRWRDVLGAVAAEVGEPQGVRTIVFELLAQASRGQRVALRLDAEPGEAATALAQLIAAALGGRARASIKSLALDGIPTLWFPDLESFEEVASGELGQQALRSGARSERKFRAASRRRAKTIGQASEVETVASASATAPKPNPGSRS
jgi:hypothetical protein